MAIKNAQELIGYLHSELTVEDLADLTDADLNNLENDLYHWREMAAAEQNRRHAARLAEVAK